MNLRLNLVPSQCSRLLSYLAILFWAMSTTQANSASPPAIPAGAEMHSLSSKGEYFDAVVKFTQVGLGNEIPLTLYLLDAVTNEPVQGATISGGMSDGSETVTVPFLESARPVVGAYQGKISVDKQLTASWLFDISHGEKSDLIAIDGFKVGDKSKIAPPATPSRKNEPTNAGILISPSEIALILLVFTALQAATFLYFRKKLTAGRSLKELR